MLNLERHFKHLSRTDASDVSLGVILPRTEDFRSVCSLGVCDLDEARQGSRKEMGFDMRCCKGNRYSVSRNLVSNHVSLAVIKNERQQSRNVAGTQPSERFFQKPYTVTVTTLYQEHTELQRSHIFTIGKKKKQSSLLSQILQETASSHRHVKSS